MKHASSSHAGARVAVFSTVTAVAPEYDLAVAASLVAAQAMLHCGRRFGVVK